MHPHFSHSLLLIFILIGISIHFPTSLCADDERYTNCNKNFTCGNIQNIGYPFWADNLRSENCGRREFELNCSGKEPQITIGSLNHRVLKMNQDSYILTVARTDYSENLCPQHLFNNSLGTSGLFDYTSDSQNASLYYKCVSIILSVPPPNRFTCNINGSNSVNYFATENIIRGQNNIIPGVNSTTLGSCAETVLVRASDSAVGNLETAFSRSTALTSAMTSDMVDALKAGYDLKWDATNSMCVECKSSGGLCGFNSTTSEFSCFCKDTAHPLNCNDEPNSSPASNSGNGGRLSTRTGLYIAGACILGIGIGLYVFFLINRRKKKRAVLAQSKELPPTPSSKSLITPSTNFSQSIPSYPSSKSDIEKGSFYFGVQVFSYSELEEATDNFDASRELGEGGFGTVYYGKLHDGRVVAVKRLFENNFKRVEQFMNEVEILTRLGHKNLVKLYGCTSRRSRELLLVYEFIPNGTVADHLHGKKNSSDGFLSWPVRLSIAIETADALAYLHRSDIIHRDVKTNNILLDNEFQVKVADFGLSRLFPTDVTHVSTAPQGTPGYVDPEYYQCYQLTSKSDVYSFGVVLIELVSSLPAVDTNRHRHDINLANMAINKIQNHALNELVDPSLGFDKDYNVRRMATAVSELAFRCLQQERDMRPTMDEVVAALKAIENQEFGSQNAEVVDIRSDDVGLLKSMPPPFSPDSIVNAKWVSSSTQSMPPPISPESVVNAKWVSNSTPPNSI